MKPACTCPGKSLSSPDVSIYMENLTSVEPPREADRQTKSNHAVPVANEALSEKERCGVRKAIDLSARLASLSVSQRLALAEFDLSLDQVESPWFGAQTLYGLRHGISYKELQALNWDQVEGMADYHLSRAEVNQTWFGHHTLFALLVGLDYEVLAGLSKLQVDALLSELLRLGYICYLEDML